MIAVKLQKEAVLTVGCLQNLKFNLSSSLGLKKSEKHLSYTMWKAKDKDSASLLSMYVFGVNWKRTTQYLSSFSNVNYNYCKKFKKYHQMIVEPFYPSLMVTLLWFGYSTLIIQFWYWACPFSLVRNNDIIRQSNTVCLTLQYFSVIVIVANAILCTGRYCYCSVLPEDIVQTFCCIDSPKNPCTVMEDYREGRRTPPSHWTATLLKVCLPPNEYIWLNDNILNHLVLGYRMLPRTDQ